MAGRGDNYDQGFLEIDIKTQEFEAEEEEKTRSFTDGGEGQWVSENTNRPPCGEMRKEKEEEEARGERERGKNRFSAAPL